MLTFERAVENAKSYLETLGPADFGRNDLQISFQFIQQHDLGWVLPYNTTKFLESKNPIDGLVGNRPLFVDIIDGSVHVISAGPIDKLVEGYAKAKMTN
jgi:hypothetical protein